MIFLLSCLLTTTITARVIETTGVVDTDIPDNFKLNTESPYDRVEILYSPKEIDETQLLLLIKGRLQDFSSREKLRKQYQNNTLIDLRFIVGTSKNAALEAVIETENKFHNDIIVGKFEDVYQNLVLKSLAGLAWVAKYGQNATYTMFMDDDVDLDLNGLRDFFLSKQSGKSPYLLCPWKNPKQARVSRRGPWAVSEMSYSAVRWPSYCGGACYLMDYKAVTILHESARSLNQPLNVGVEDAFITGVLRKRSGIDVHTTTPFCKHNINEESVTGQFLKNRNL